MGCSVNVSARSRSLKDRMASFVSDVYRPWTDIDEDGDDTQFDGPLHRGKLGIGFDYTAGSGSEWEYSFAFMRWVALKIGRRRCHFEGHTFKVPVPYITDSTRVRPVLIDEVWSESSPEPYKCCVVDQFGLLTCPHPARDLAWHHIPEGTYERISATYQGKSTEDIQEALIQSGIERARVVLQYIRAEIARLDVLWPL